MNRDSGTSIISAGYPKKVRVSLTKTGNLSTTSSEINQADYLVCLFILVAMILSRCKDDLLGAFGQFFFMTLQDQGAGTSFRKGNRSLDFFF